MWFKIELHKDNTVASCEQVSGSREGGKAVHFIEAASKAEAINTLLSRYATNNASRREAALERANKLRSEGLCRRCGRTRCREGLTTCDACLTRRNSRHAERKAGAPPLDQRAKTEAEKIQVQARRQVYDVQKAMRKAAGHLIMVRVAYARCLQALDTMTPSAYRLWLTEALRQAQEKEKASAMKRARQQEYAPSKAKHARK